MILTEAARQRLRTLASLYPHTPFLRVAIMPGGCSGLRKDLTLVAAPEPDDTLLPEGSGGLLIDPVSAPFLEHAILDWQSTLANSTFELHIPNTNAQCGCGASFALP